MTAIAETHAPGEDDRLANAPRRFPWNGLVALLSLLWIVATTWWVLRLWGVLRDAAPVLAMFEAEAGGPLTEIEWMRHEEAGAIFCPHPEIDPSTTRIGRFIDASWAYLPALIMFGVPIYGGGGLLALFASTARTRFIRRLAMVIVAAALLQIGLLVSEYGTLQTLTYITE